MLLNKKNDIGLVQPLVSIIIPAYNAEKYIAEAIQSAIGQTWPRKEIIIIDDGSTDNSLAVAKKYESDFVTVITQTNKGASAARNRGLAESNGDYVQFLDADDLLSPDKIAAQMNVLNGSLTHLSTSKTVHYFDGADHLQAIPTEDWTNSDSDSPVDFLAKLYAGREVLPGYGGFVTVHSWLTPKALIEKAGPWNEQLSTNDDGEFFCRVALCSTGIRYSSKGLNYYRKFRDGNSLSGKATLKAQNSVLASLNLQYNHLKAKTDDPIIDIIFARHYWERGVIAYPQFKDLSDSCINKAVKLGYKGEKYFGGPAGKKIADFFGWKTARFLLYFKQRLKFLPVAVI